MDLTPGDDYVLRLKSNTDTEESDRICVPWIACFCLSTKFLILLFVESVKSYLLILNSKEDKICRMVAWIS